jgi:hypothetical protein
MGNHISVCGAYGNPADGERFQKEKGTCRKIIKEEPRETFKKTAIPIADTHNRNFHVCLFRFNQCDFLCGF